LPDTAVPAPGAAGVGPRWFSGRRSDCASTVPLSVSVELDIARAPQPDGAPVILDLRELEFMHSSGAHLIAAANSHARQAAGRLVVVRDPAEVERIFALVGLDRQPEPGRSSTSATTGFCPGPGLKP
jgi:anti-anti-sigma regulatory factor